MKFSFTVRLGPKAHKIEWEKEFLIEDLIFIIDSLFKLDNKNFLLSDQEGFS
jgi:hypothetical protein